MKKTASLFFGTLPPMALTLRGCSSAHATLSVFL